jgi:hypothetical protein
MWGRLATCAAVPNRRAWSFYISRGFAQIVGQALPPAKRRLPTAAVTVFGET